MSKADSISPQPGPQSAFSSSRADIVVYGGSAGGGKSFALLMEPLRFCQLQGFTSIIFRRTTPEIRNPGGLWDDSEKIYSRIPGARAFSSRLTWTFFPSNAVIKFGHLEHEKNKFDHQGAQYAFIGFDELTHFSESQFWYLLSRNRSSCGVKPYIRATCNPDPDSFVARLIAWWIDQDTGFAIPERSGVIRWFIRQKNVIEWFDSREEIVDRYGTEQPDGSKRLSEEFEPKSFTFIPSSIYDNKALLAKDPGYLANLNALPTVERERLKRGNWKIRATAGNLCRRSWFEIVDSVPKRGLTRLRYWDKAATEPGPENPDPDWTAGALMSRSAEGIYYIEHMAHDRLSPLGVDRLMRNTATQDGMLVPQHFEQEPGASGKADAEATIRLLSGFIVKAHRKRVNKLIAWKPFLSQCEAGNVKLVRGDWNDDFLDEMEALDESLQNHDDQADAVSGAFNELQDTGPDYSLLGRVR